MNSARAVLSLVLAPVLATVLALSACSSGGGVDSGEPTDPEASGVVADLLTAASGDEQSAIVGTLLAADRGYTLEQIADAAAEDTLEVESGEITGAEPLGAPQGVYAAAARAQRATAVPARAVRQGPGADREQVASAARIFLETEPSTMLSGLGADPVGLPPPPVASPEAAPLGAHLALTLVLLGSGYSPEQIVTALILGDRPVCSEGTCTLGGDPPLLAGQPSFIDVLLGTEQNSQASVAGEWSGELNYSDDTITLEMITNTVSVTRDADGVFTMTALLAYRTIPDTGTCSFEWTKEFEGTGELDASATTIDFTGAESVVSTSSCPDANTVDNLAEVVRRVSVVDGNKLEGVVATGEFSISGPQVG
ncbi:hypothetical protein [Nocardioides sp.]|uniref:hypothetical protein n=1 Tax=Nocardioides sp. TaxID=35761 RepID=UPI0035684823